MKGINDLCKKKKDFRCFDFEMFANNIEISKKERYVLIISLRSYFYVVSKKERYVLILPLRFY